MKKLLSIILALALVMSLSVPAFAADETRKVDLSFYEEENGPVYTVTIPGSLDLTRGDNWLTITCFTDSLFDKTVTVTFEGTQTSNQFVLHTDWIGNQSYNLAYRLYDFNNVYVGYAPFPGRVLVEFDTKTYSGNLEEKIRIFIDPDDTINDGIDFQPGVPYSGYIIFGIKLS